MPFERGVHARPRRSPVAWFEACTSQTGPVRWVSPAARTTPRDMDNLTADELIANFSSGMRRDPTLGLRAPLRIARQSGRAWNSLLRSWASR
jgi:hypothetical protein